MTHDAYLKSDSAQAHLHRAAVIAAVNISVFEYLIGTTDSTTSEHDRLTGCGGCTQACAHVAKLPWGGQACRSSREKAARATFKRQKPVPFLCHMGFSCVAMPAVKGKDSMYTMFMGPFCPSEAPGSLDRDAIEALGKLENTTLEELPFSLEDIPEAAAVAMPEIVEWLAETLTQDWARLSAPPSPTSVVATEVPRPSNKRPQQSPMPAQFDAGAIVAALVGGDAGQARGLVQSQISGGNSRRRTQIPSVQARSVAVVATVLEWAEQAEMDTRLCWAKFTEFQGSIQQWETVEDLTKAAMKVLQPIRRQVQQNRRKTTDTQYDFVPMNTLIKKHFKTGITLKKVAGILEENPTTITKRLQRTFALSFSKYVGQMRIEQAKKLFRTTQLNTGEVAQRIGINDSANFAKLFRAHTQLSPTQYRAQHGKKGAKR